MRIDRTIFFAGLRSAVFGGRLSEGQVTGIEAVLTRFCARGWSDPRWLAYMLATAHHETGGTMRAVRETFAESNDQAVERLERAFRGGKLPTVKTPYWRPDAKGLSYYGRGLVQITHRENYVTMSRVVGHDLVAEPDLALRLDVAATILVVGMSEGLFSGAKLGDFFSGMRADWTGARRVVNGRDRARAIAAKAQIFDAAIRLALVV
jgi:hypothetical protein